jgi:hypothetical protein
MSNGLRVWLDDVREMPEGFDMQVYNPYYLIHLLREGGERIDYISFDHDLGCEEADGYTVAVMIEQMAYDGMVRRIGWDVHSANPVGRKRIEYAMEEAEEIWKAMDEFYGVD